MRPFEMESDLEAYADPVSIYNKKQKVSQWKFLFDIIF